MNFKVLHISTSDSGGAAIAAYRIHEGLVQANVDSTFLTLIKSSSNKINHLVYDGPIIDNKPSYPILTIKNVLIEKFYKKYSNELNAYEKKRKQITDLKTPTIENSFANFEIFSEPTSQFDLTECKAYKEADIIHLHWVADFLNYESFFTKNKKPIVWTLHDENPFRGGFHYLADEIRNQKKYAKVDLLYKKMKEDIVARQDKLLVITPSNWLGISAKSSSIFSERTVKTIRYNLDINLFSLKNRKYSREYFGIPEDRIVFMFVAQHVKNYRKGFDLLLPLIEDEDLKEVYFLIVGENKFQCVNNKAFFLNSVNDERLMPLIYSASDYLILSSREDNLPNTMVESLSCGTPVIGFNIGDNVELLKDNELGLICNEISTESLKSTLLEAITKRDFFSSEKISMFAHQLFDPLQQSSLYIDEYINLLK